MQDVFIEYMVKRKSTVGTTFLKVGIVAGAIIISVLLFTFSGLLGPLSMLGTLLAFGALYGGYYLLTSLNVEFEYVITNGEMDVDQITAERKRKRLVSVNCREVEAFGKYKAAEHQNKAYQSKIIACDAEDSSDVWYLAARLKDKGLTLVVFNANEKMLNGVKPFLPRPVMHEAFKAWS